MGGEGSVVEGTNGVARLDTSVGKRATVGDAKDHAIVISRTKCSSELVGDTGGDGFDFIEDFQQFREVVAEAGVLVVVVGIVFQLLRDEGKQGEAEAEVALVVFARLGDVTGPLKEDRFAGADDMFVKGREPIGISDGTHVVFHIVKEVTVRHDLLAIGFADGIDERMTELVKDEHPHGFRRSGGATIDDGVRPAYEMRDDAFGGDKLGAETDTIKEGGGDVDKVCFVLVVEVCHYIYKTVERDDISDRVDIVVIKRLVALPEGFKVCVYGEAIEHIGQGFDIRGVHLRSGVQGERIHQFHVGRRGEPEHDGSGIIEIPVFTCLIEPGDGRVLFEGVEVRPDIAIVTVGSVIEFPEVWPVAVVEENGEEFYAGVDFDFEGGGIVPVGGGAGGGEYQA